MTTQCLGAYLLGIGMGAVIAVSVRIFAGYIVQCASSLGALKEHKRLTPPNTCRRQWQ